MIFVLKYKLEVMIMEKYFVFETSEKTGEIQYVEYLEYHDSEGSTSKVPTGIVKTFDEYQKMKAEQEEKITYTDNLTDLSEYRKTKKK